MELRRYLSVVRHRLPLIVAILVGALIAAYAITPRQARYAASTTIYVGPQNLALDSITSAAGTGAGVAAYDRYINTFVNMINDQNIAENARKLTGVPRSTKTIQAETAAFQLPLTNLMVIKVTDASPTYAKNLADAVASAFVDEANQLSAGNNASAFTKPTQKAVLPTTPLSSGLIKNVILGLLLGAVIAALVVALLEYLDITIRGADDAERKLGLPVLGVIPALGERLPSGPVIRVHAPSGDARRRTPARGATARG